MIEVVVHPVAEVARVVVHRVGDLRDTSAMTSAGLREGTYGASTLEDLGGGEALLVEGLFMIEGGE